MLKIKPLKAADLVPMIMRALDSGPKTVIGTRLWIEMREEIWVSDVEVVEALHHMMEAGLVQAQELGMISGLDAVDGRQRVGPSMLYSLAVHEERVCTDRRSAA